MDLICQDWFPFAVPEVAEDGLPFQQWDGTTVFDDGSNSYPSKSSSEKITVFGNNSLYCFPMTLAQAAEWYWRVKKVQSKVRFSTLGNIVTNQGTTTQFTDPNLGNERYGYRSFSSADQVMDRSGSGARNEHRLTIGTASEPYISMGSDLLNIRTRFNNYEGWGQAVTVSSGTIYQLTIRELFVEYFQELNFADFISQKSGATTVFWLNPLQLYLHWRLYGTSEFANYGSTLIHDRTIDQSSIITPSGHSTSVPVTIKLSQQTLSANHFQVFNITGDGILNNGTAISITDPSGLSISIVPAEYYTYGGVWNASTGLPTGT